MHLRKNSYHALCLLIGAAVIISSGIGSLGVNSLLPVNESPLGAFELSPEKISSGYVYWHNNNGYVKYSDTAMWIGHDFDFWNEAWRGWTEWNLSSLPADAIITSVEIRLQVTGKPDEADNYRAQICMTEISERPSLAQDAQALYEQIGTGVLYQNGLCVSITGPGYFPSSDGYFDLGPIAAANMTARISQGWFAIGFQDYNAGGSDNPDDEGLIFTVSAIRLQYQIGLISTTPSYTVPSSAYTLSNTSNPGDNSEPDWIIWAILGIIGGIFCIIACLGFAHKRQSKVRPLQATPKKIEPVAAIQQKIVPESPTEAINETYDDLLPTPPTILPSKSSRRPKQKVLDGASGAKEKSATDIFVCEFCGEKIDKNSPICPFCSNRVR